MNLSLTDEEAQLLARLLKSDLANLKEETGKTENYDWRVEYKKDEQVLREIIGRLEAKTPT